MKNKGKIKLLCPNCHSNVPEREDPASLAHRFQVLTVHLRRGGGGGRLHVGATPE